MHSRSTAAWLVATLALAASGQAQAVELLTSGDFEPPGNLGPVPGWTLEEFATSSAQVVNTAELTSGTDPRLFLRAFEGGGPRHERQGNFDNDGLPIGDVDGHDFLTWQRNFGRTFGALPSDGDATGGVGGAPDGRVNTADFNIWKANFGHREPLLTNARLSQVVPATAGETYTFKGSSTFELNFSGGPDFTTLGNDSPFGQIASPTVTQFKLEFLNDANTVLNSKVLDLRQDYEGELVGSQFAHTPLTETAPAGTTKVRVVAEALNMAWNGTTTTNGAAQSAFFNDFSLNAGASTTDLLNNGNLNEPLPDALDFWNQEEGPVFTNSFEVLRTASFANHTTGGALGVWLSAFLGASSNLDPVWSSDPVTGTISQTVDAVPGGTYNFSGWSRFEENYSGGVDTITGGGLWATRPDPTSPTVTEIRLDFLNAAEAVIGSAVIDVKAARRADPASGGNANDNQWRQHSLQAVAPASTVKARLSASMINGVYHAGGAQSAFFDDFSLDGPAVGAIATAVVPEPSSLAALAIGWAVVAHRRRRS